MSTKNASLNLLRAMPLPVSGQSCNNLALHKTKPAFVLATLMLPRKKSYKVHPIFTQVLQVRQRPQLTRSSYMREHHLRALLHY